MRSLDRLRRPHEHLPLLVGFATVPSGPEQRVLLRVPPPQAAEPHTRREAPASSPVDEAVEHRLRNLRSGSVEPRQTGVPAERSQKHDRRSSDQEGNTADRSPT
jgi:hypothetical protein